MKKIVYPLYLPDLPDFWWMDPTDPDQWAQGPDGRLWAIHYDRPVSADLVDGLVVNIRIGNIPPLIAFHTRSRDIFMREIESGMGHYSLLGYQTLHKGIRPEAARHPSLIAQRIA